MTGTLSVRIGPDSTNIIYEVSWQHTSKSWFAISVVVLLNGVRIDAWSQGLATDRPDFTESAVVVPVGALLFEGGGTYSQLGDSHSEYVLGEGLLRWGVSDVAELRFGPPSFVSRSNGRTDSGLGDGNIGAKIALGQVWTHWDLAVIASTSLPIGDEAFSSEEFEPSLILTTGRALDPKSSVGAQITAALPTDGSNRSFEWGATIVLGSNLGPNTGGFVEIAATVPESGTAPLVGHAGITHRFSDRFQIDAHAGMGLSDSAPDVFLGVGLARQLQ